jgi:hypothetical protein
VNKRIAQDAAFYATMLGTAVMSWQRSDNNRIRCSVALNKMDRTKSYLLSSISVSTQKTMTLKWLSPCHPGASSHPAQHRTPRNRSHLSSSSGKEKKPCKCWQPVPQKEPRYWKWMCHAMH